LIDVGDNVDHICLRASVVSLPPPPPNPPSIIGTMGGELITLTQVRVEELVIIFENDDDDIKESKFNYH
jgi:hypothetical protein